MSAIFPIILTKLQKKLAIDIPEIRYINLDLGQLENYEERPPVTFPCLLVDFDSPYIPRQQDRQWANITMKLRLAFDSYSDTSNLAPDEVQTQGLSYFEIEEKLYTSIQDWDVSGFLIIKPFERTLAATEKRPDFRVREIKFNGQYEDGAALIDDGDAGGSPSPESTVQCFSDWWPTVIDQDYVDVGSVQSASVGKQFLLTDQDDVILIARESDVYNVVTGSPVGLQARFNKSTLRIEFDPANPFNAGETIFVQFKRRQG